MDTWSVVQTSVQHNGGIAALVANSLLLVLILKKSPKSLGAYKYLMIYITLFQIAYAILDILLHASIHTKDSCWIVSLNSHKTVLPLSTLYFFDLIFCGSFGTSLGNFAVHFVFRHLAVTGVKQWTKPSTIVFWLSISAIFGTVWTLTCHVFLQRSNTADEVLQSDELAGKNETISDIVYLGLCFYKDNSENGVSEVNWWSVTGSLTFSGLLIFSSSIMFVFGWKCYFMIKNMTHKSIFSEKYRALQAQLFNALVFQTLIPFVMMHIPCSLVNMCALVGGAPVFFGRTMSISVAVFPALDPLPNMFIIKNYRQAIIEYLKRIFCIEENTVLPTNVPEASSRWNLCCRKTKRFMFTPQIYAI